MFCVQGTMQSIIHLILKIAFRSRQKYHTYLIFGKIENKTLKNLVQIDTTREWQKWVLNSCHPAALAMLTITCHTAEMTAKQYKA